MRLKRLISHPTVLELETRKAKIECNELLMESTTKEKLEMEKFKSVKSITILRTEIYLIYRKELTDF